MILLEIDKGLLAFVGYGIAVIIAFILMREINLWYFKINESISNQKEQIRLLKKIAGEVEEKKEEETAPDKK